MIQGSGPPGENFLGMATEFKMEIVKAPQALTPKLMAGVKKRCKILGQDMVNYIKTQMSKQGTGRTYRVPGTSRTYVASAPGEYPVTRTGRLKTSLRTRLFANGSAILGVAVGTSIEDPYPAILEAGLRPWLTRAFHENTAHIKTVLSQAWRDDLLNP